MDMRSAAMMFAGLIMGVPGIAVMAGCTPTTTQRYACRRECPGFLTITRTASGSPATAWANRRNKADKMSGLYFWDDRLTASVNHM
jgi:hypothetical protein